MFLKLRRIVRFGRREGGVAAVEFALCLFPLLLILGGIIDFGLFCNMQLTITSASWAGARYATLYTVNASGQRLAPNNLSPTVSSYVTTNYSGLLPSNADLQATLGGSAATSTTSGASPVTVTVTAKYYWLIFGHLVPGLANPQTLSSAVEMSLE
ncbi:MAG: TadE/TadG family type IV pilus assembly protein [Desulfobaccales bacterium]